MGACTDGGPWTLQILGPSDDCGECVAANWQVATGMPSELRAFLLSGFAYHQQFSVAPLTIRFFYKTYHKQNNYISEL